MYGIVIGASDEAIYAIKKAQSKGITVLAFDGDEHAAGLQYADEAFVVDIRDVNNIIKVIDEKGIQPKDMFVLPVPIGRYLISTGAEAVEFAIRNMMSFRIWSSARKVLVWGIRFLQYCSVVVYAKKTT